MIALVFISLFLACGWVVTAVELHSVRQRQKRRRASNGRFTKRFTPMSL